MGGTTTVVDFAIQPKGSTLRAALETWQEKARGKACIDYGFHVAITDLPDSVLDEMPEMVEAGVSSFKLFMAYKGSLQVDDSTFFKALVKARECGALISFHGENGDVIDVLVKRMLAAGQTTPRYHALSRPPEAEAEATARAIALAEMAGAPIYVVHLSAASALDKVMAARDRGLPVYAETCPQYLLKSIEDYDEPDFGGAKYVCSPPLRDKSNWPRLWAGLAAGHLQTVATDRKILDFSSQLLNLNVGHKHPKVIEAIQEQAGKLCYIGPSFANGARAELARMLAEKAPGDLTRVLFTTGGVEANENAIKAVRLATGRRKIITRYRSYHGATAGAISLSGDNRRWANEPGIDGIVRVHDPYCYRCAFKQKPESCDLECVKNIEEMIGYEGSDQIAAILVEGLTGTNGIFVTPPGYMPALRALCDKYGILLVVDEVMSGFGRTGEWFAVDHWKVVPDVITFAKGVNSGYVPLGGMILSKKLSDFFEDHMFWGGLTYSGHPLACAAGIATMKVYEEEGLIENSRRLGTVLLDELKMVREKHPSVGDVRGLGLFCGVELVKDRETREPITPWNSPAAGVAAPLSKELMSLGIFIFCRWNMLFIAPPLVINEEELRYGVSLIDKALAVADAAANS